MKPVALVTSVFLALIALGHLARLVVNLEVVLAGWKLPLWPSAPAFLFTGGLALLLARESRKG